MKKNMTIQDIKELLDYKNNSLQYEYEYNFTFIDYDNIFIRKITKTQKLRNIRKEKLQKLELL